MQREKSDGVVPQGGAVMLQGVDHAEHAHQRHVDGSSETPVFVFFPFIIAIFGFVKKTKVLLKKFNRFKRRKVGREETGGERGKDVEGEISMDDGENNCCEVGCHTGQDYGHCEENGLEFADKFV